MVELQLNGITEEMTMQEAQSKVQEYKEFMNAKYWQQRHEDGSIRITLEHENGFDFGWIRPVAIA